MVNNDIALVREFAATGSEEAFAEVVSRHVNLVFSVALRSVRNRGLAEEVTQAVFILLARKAPSLGDGTILSSWLCRTARNMASNALTIQRRRQEREQQAYMQSQLIENESVAWSQIEPLLEPALSELGEKDHNALVMRFFEGRSFADVSEALGTTEAAAKMRVNRALEKLRKFFEKHGRTLSVGVIAGAIASNSVQAAPAGLAKSVTAAAVMGVGVKLTTLNLIQTTLKLMTYSKLKLAAAGLGVAICLGGVADLAVQFVRADDTRATSSSADIAFAGYQTPQAAYKSFVYLQATGDLEKTLAACTPEQADRIRKRVAGLSPAELRKGMMEEAKHRGNYIVREKQVMSDTEVRLLLEVQPYEGHPRVGNDLQVMQKVDEQWKYAGKFGVDVKPQ
jgi:RNA polymerase sigma factor (sigma-70 family)